MRLISWNIDSLNAALTSDSARAKLTRGVLNTIKEKDPDIIAIQETKLRIMFGVLLKNLHEKVMLGQCFYIKILSLLK